MTDQEIVGFLARELMEFRVHANPWAEEQYYAPEGVYTDHHGEASGKSYGKVSNWNPLAQTPDGYFQCFGPGGVVERICKMLKSLGLELRRGCISGTWEGMIPGRDRGVWVVGPAADTINKAACLIAVRMIKEHLATLEALKDHE